MTLDLENCTVEEIETGVRHSPPQHQCLLCGQVFSEGEIYRFGQRFFTAATAAQQHVQQCHGPLLAQLLQGDNRYLGVTEHQKTLLALLAEGKSDAEIAAATGATAATVRRQRFTFREKAKQAKMYLAVYQLATKGGAPAKEALLPVPMGAGADDRFVITEKESRQYLQNAFASLEPPRLKHFPKKEKRKVAVLHHIASQFAPGQNYTEKQVNDILAPIYHDYVTLRRYLVEYGYLDRERDGSRYWLRTGAAAAPMA